MSVFDDMARDGGYTGDQAREIAWLLEQQQREEYEEEQRAAHEAEHFPLVWRWRTVRDPCRPFETAHAVWGKPRAIPHPLAHRVGHRVREVARGANGARLLEFVDGHRVVAPFYSVGRA